MLPAAAVATREACTARGIDSGEAGETLAARPEGQEPGPQGAPKTAADREAAVQEVMRYAGNWADAVARYHEAGGFSRNPQRDLAKNCNDAYTTLESAVRRLAHQEKL